MNRKWWLVLSLLLLQGCSAIKLGYQQLPTLSYWWLDSAVDFDDAQAIASKDALSRLHNWHRKNELVTYADWLGRNAQASQGDVDSAQVCQEWTEVQSGMARLMKQTLALVTPVAQQLGPRQINHLALHFEAKNEDWEKEWLQGSSSERLKRRLDKLLARYNDFYGELTPSQVTMVRQHLEQSAWSPEWGRQDRQRRQQDLLASLQRISQSQMTPAQAESLLAGVGQRWLMPKDAAGKEMMPSMARQACNNLAQLHNTTSPEQRQRVARRIKAYERDLRSLALP